MNSINREAHGTRFRVLFRFGPLYNEGGEGLWTGSPPKIARRLFFSPTRSNPTQLATNNPWGQTLTGGVWAKNSKPLFHRKRKGLCNMRRFLVITAVLVALGVVVARSEWGSYVCT